MDPFRESGVVLDMARLEGRRAVGVDVSGRACEIAGGRLVQERLVGV